MRRKKGFALWYRLRIGISKARSEREKRVYSHSISTLKKKTSILTLALNRIIFKGGEYRENKAAPSQTHNKAGL